MTFLEYTMYCTFISIGNEWTPHPHPHPPTPAHPHPPPHPHPPTPPPHPHPHPHLPTPNSPPPPPPTCHPHPLQPAIVRENTSSYNTLSARPTILLSANLISCGSVCNNGWRNSRDLATDLIKILLAFQFTKSSWISAYSLWYMFVLQTLYEYTVY